MDTFIVRVWMPADGTCWDMILRGAVRHVATGIETSFRGNAQILELLGTPFTSPENRAPLAENSNLT